MSALTFRGIDVMLGYVLDKYNLENWLSGLSTGIGAIVELLMVLLVVVLPFVIWGKIWYGFGKGCGVFGCKVT